MNDRAFRKQIERTHDRAFVGLLISFFLLIVGGVGCSSMSVTSEKRQGVSLARYGTYAWAPIHDESQGRDEILDHNIQLALDASLEQAGFTQVSPDSNPNFLVRYFVTAQNVMVPVPGGVGPGFGGPYWAGNMIVPPTVEFYREGSLVVDFIDNRTRKPFWRGIATSRIDPQTDAAQKVKMASHKIVEEYQEDVAKQSHS